MDEANPSAPHIPDWATGCGPTPQAAELSDRDSPIPGLWFGEGSGAGGGGGACQTLSTGVVSGIGGGGGGWMAAAPEVRLKL